MKERLLNNKLNTKLVIGVFDSGIGGLSVLAEFLKRIPRYDYIYLGDDKNAPYGNKSFGEIYNNTCKALDFLFSKGALVVIIACNTASARALRKVQQEYMPDFYPNRKVLGIIIPTVEKLNDLNQNSSVALLATRATIKSEVYNLEIKKRKINISLNSKAVPLLASIIENDFYNKKRIEKYLKKALREIKKHNNQYLILACTHYFLIKEDIKKHFDDNLKIINTPKEAAIKLRKYLKKHKDLEKKLSKKIS